MMRLGDIDVVSIGMEVHGFGMAVGIGWCGVDDVEKEGKSDRRNREQRKEIPRQ